MIGRRLGLALMAMCQAAALAALAAPPPETSPPAVFVAEVDTIIHPVSAEFMIDAIERADAAHASLLVFKLTTPGGLVESTEQIVSRMLAAKTPIAVFVGPAGARAASAGFVIVMAADLAVMARGTRIGAAAPVAGGGEKLDETLAKKAAADLAAQVRTMATRRGRNAALADEAVHKARAFTEDEALGASPPLIDLIANDVDELLRVADGRAVKRFDGTTTVLRTKGAVRVPIEMSWRQRVLSAIANPNVAYLLLSLGTLGLTIELWSPGAVLPGVVGGLCLLLAFFAFQVLPVNYAGLLLILFGLMLLILEVKVISFGLLSAGGILSLALGAMILVDSDAPELQVSLRVIIPVTIAIAGIVIFLVRLAVMAQRRRSVTGDAGMIDQIGRALTMIAPGRPGRIATLGEIWDATADEPIAEGEGVRVTAVEGLTLKVRRADAGAHGGQA